MSKLIGWSSTIIGVGTALLSSPIPDNWKHWIAAATTVIAFVAKSPVPAKKEN